MTNNSNSNPTQCRRILDYIAVHGGITPMEAIIDLGVFRLASRISEMRKDGIDIKDEWVKVTNRFGETCRVKKYSMGGGSDGKQAGCDDLF